MDSLVQQKKFRYKKKRPARLANKFRYLPWGSACDRIILSYFPCFCAADVLNRFPRYVSVKNLNKAMTDDESDYLRNCIIDCFYERRRETGVLPSSCVATLNESQVRIGVEKVLLSLGFQPMTPFYMGNEGLMVRMYIRIQREVAPDE